MPNSEIERLAEKYEEKWNGDVGETLVAALSEMRGIALKEAAEILTEAADKLRNSTNRDNKYDKRIATVLTFSAAAILGRIGSPV